MSAKNPGNAILTVQDVVRGYGAQPVLDRVSLSIHEGERLGLIGRNGCGKSTLLRIMAGLDEPEQGLVTRMQGLRVSLLPQVCGLPRDRTVAQTLAGAGTPVRALLAHYHRAVEELAAVPADSPAHAAAQEQVEALSHHVAVLDGWDLPTEVKRLETALELPPGDRTLAGLSGGELRRVDLAVKILERPDLLLLDEPTNHIDTRSVEWVERFLIGYRGACVLVTHDRYFLDRAVTRIAELEFSRIYSFPGTYADLLAYKSNIEEQRAREESNRLGFIRRELEWIKRGPKARGTKQKARIQRFEAVQEQGPGARHRAFDFEIPQPERLAKTVLEARDVMHGYDDAPLVRQFSVIMQKGMRVGIVGPNGCGKTTLLRLLMGLEEPRKGRLVIGETVRFCYVDQTHEDVNPGESILDFVSNGQRFWDVGPRRIFVPAYLGDFLFDKASVHMPMGNLSGGERNRLDIARRLLRGGNFLVLDEPTNDLDLYTLRVLEEAILDFDGCALLVSHDRYFLNRLCTHMWVFEDDGHITQVTGNYDDVLRYREQQKDVAGAGGAAARRATDKAPREKAREAVKKRLTYMEQKELASMEETILDAEEDVARIEGLVTQPAFYQQEGERVRATLRELEEARERVARLYARWQELEART